MTTFTLFSGLGPPLDRPVPGATADAGAAGATNVPSVTFTLAGPAGSYGEAAINYSMDAVNWRPMATVKVSPTGPLTMTTSFDIGVAWRYFQGVLMSLSPGATASLTLTT